MIVTRAACLSFFVAAAAMGADENASALPKFSPFEARGGGAAAAPAANENFEFAGITTVGTRTDLIFYDKTSKKSHWIRVGETKEGISVLNYDSRREQVVVKVNGVDKTLQLRKARGPINPALGVAAVPTGFNVAPSDLRPVTMPAFTPTPVPPPTVVPPQAGPDPTLNAGGMKPQAPATPEGQAKQETEARMLVSDLLEIGMAQRKAYEDAQRKAAEGNAQPAAQPPQGSPPTAPNGR